MLLQWGISTFLGLRNSTDENSQDHFVVHLSATYDPFSQEQAKLIPNSEIRL